MLNFIRTISKFPVFYCHEKNPQIIDNQSVKFQCLKSRFTGHGLSMSSIQKTLGLNKPMAYIFGWTALYSYWNTLYIVELFNSKLECTQDA